MLASVSRITLTRLTPSSLPIVGRSFISRYASNSVKLIRASCTPIEPDGVKVPVKTLRIGCCDSGLGGALFLIDMVKSQRDFLIDIQSKYNLNVEFVHYGDAANAPYGGKSAEVLTRLTYGLIRTMAELNCQLAIIACNTASTTYDAAMTAEMARLHPGMAVHEIIIPTAKTLRETARLVPNTKGKNELHIGILATRATVLSQKYPFVLAELHRQQFGDSALTVVINNDPFIKEKSKFTRVFEGKSPLSRGSREEKMAFAKIREGTNNDPVQFIHVHAPANWVSIMEGTGDYAKLSSDECHSRLNAEVKTEMDNCFKFAKDFYGNHTDSPLDGFSVLGLCCTHYPYVQHQIKNALWDKRLHGVKVVSQGDSFGKRILQPAIEKWITTNDITRREIPIPIAQVKQSAITSYTSLDPKKQTDRESALRPVKDGCKLMDPEIAARIVFNTVEVENPSSISMSSLQSLFARFGRVQKS